MNPNAQLASLDAGFIDWALPASEQEVDISNFSGQAWAGWVVPTPSIYKPDAETRSAAWTGNTQSQRVLDRSCTSTEPTEPSSAIRRGTRDDFSDPVSSSVSPPTSAQSVAAAVNNSLPAQSSTSNFSSRAPSDIRIAGRETKRVTFEGSCPGATAPRSAPKRVQFQEMTTTYQQWTRSGDGRSNGHGVSPAADMMKPESARDASHRPTDSSGPETSILRARQVDAFSDGKGSLPAEKGFPIQIGSELFRLSGASIMSDGQSSCPTKNEPTVNASRAPSYFSKFFEEQMRSNEDGPGSVKTLYIDRDPITFQDIALHLQGKHFHDLTIAYSYSLGYRVVPRDGYHYVKLFADAQFYGCRFIRKVIAWTLTLAVPQLIKQLFESEYFIRIGEKDFRISKDVFSSPGNTPNFFSLGFAIFSPSPGEVFPGLPSHGLFRPPSIEAPALLNRSASTFADILHLLRGYPLQIRSQEHRTELLRDCRYYHLRGLEQQLIQHSISYNVARQKSEIIIRLEDIRQSGVSFPSEVKPSGVSPLAGWVNYARPFVDETSYELVLELGDESTRIQLRTMRAEFFGQAKARIASLFQVVANKMNLPTNAPLGLTMSTGEAAAQPVRPGNTPLSDDLVKVDIEHDAYVILDGKEYDIADLPTPVTFGGDDTDISMAYAGTGHAGEMGSVHLQPSIRSSSASQPSRKRARRSSLDDFGEWVIQKGQWRLRVQPRPERETDNGPGMEIVMMAVKLDAVSGQRGRNAARAFLN